MRPKELGWPARAAIPGTWCGFWTLNLDPWACLARLFHDNSLPHPTFQCFKASNEGVFDREKENPRKCGNGYGTFLKKANFCLDIVCGGTEIQRTPGYIVRLSQKRHPNNSSQLSLVTLDSLLDSRGSPLLTLCFPEFLKHGHLGLDKI